MSPFVCKQFGSQSEEFGIIMLPFMNSISGDKQNFGSHMWSSLPVVEIVVADKPVHTCFEAFLCTFLVHTILFDIIQSAMAPKKV